MEERLRNKLLKMQADLHHAIKTLEESKTFKITFHTARENIRDYLGHIEGNEINLGHESIDSTDKLYEGQVYPFVIALIPAHNEELRIENTLNSGYFRSIYLSEFHIEKKINNFQNNLFRSLDR